MNYIDQTKTKNCQEHLLGLLNSMILFVRQIARVGHRIHAINSPAIETAAVSLVLGLRRALTQLKPSPKLAGMGHTAHGCTEENTELNMPFDYRNHKLL